MKTAHLKLGFAILISLAISANAITISVSSQVTDLNVGLKNIAAALGLLVIVHAGMRWIFMSDNPQERDDAKKTIIYVIVGLLLVDQANNIVGALYKPA